MKTIDLFFLFIFLNNQINGAAGKDPKFVPNAGFEDHGRFPILLKAKLIHSDYETHLPTDNETHLPRQNDNIASEAGVQQPQIWMNFYATDEAHSGVPYCPQVYPSAPSPYNIFIAAMHGKDLNQFAAQLMQPFSNQTSPLTYAIINCLYGKNHEKAFAAIQMLLKHNANANEQSCYYNNGEKYNHTPLEIVLNVSSVRKEIILETSRRHLWTEVTELLLNQNASMPANLQPHHHADIRKAFANILGRIYAEFAYQQEASSLKSINAQNRIQKYLNSCKELARI